MIENESVAGRVGPAPPDAENENERAGVRGGEPATRMEREMDAVTLSEVAIPERNAIAECVMHEIMLHLPDSDSEQAFAVGMAVIPRVLRDLGLATLVDAATAYDEARNG